MYEVRTASATPGQRRPWVELLDIATYVAGAAPNYHFACHYEWHSLHLRQVVALPH